ncbi:unnamed protein product [Symbiodinium sp. CCMP2592]|nr:unnamed protein product [Symbiodinium sp. CCMP2592]
MASEAAMTWRRAQQATAAVRKDRGFGAGSAFRAAIATDQCHLCGGFGHFARDCKGGGKKGKGKGAHTMEYDYDYYDDTVYYVGGGKGKKKGKTKGNFGLSKGPMHKGKGGKPIRVHPGVNAYGMEMLGSLGDPSLFQASQERDAISPDSGLLDCGATASAGPEASVQRLIAAVIEQDSQATITIDQSRRPYFRYGSGAWGRAQYHVTIGSKVSGKNKQFEVYALPNPPEYVEPWFRHHMLVPILVGMSHIGATGAGMIIDFNDGSFLNAADIANHRELPPEEARHMSSNAKGHYILNLVEYLTGGQVCKEGNCSVVVKHATPTPFSVDHEPTSDHVPLPGTDADLPLQFMYPLEMFEATPMLMSSEQNDDVEFRRLSMKKMLQCHMSETSNAAAKSSAMPALDPERLVEADPRDPRALRTQWPCYGYHPEVSVGNNKYGQWKHCAVCSYRLSYTPREGAPGSDTKTENFVTVRRALSQLHADIGDVQVIEEMVKVAIEMEYAKNRYHQLIQKFDKKKAVATHPKPAATTSTPVATTTSGYKVTVENELLNPNLVDMEATVPKRVAQCIMAAFTVLAGTYRNEMQNFLAESGLRAYRVNHANGYDLYKRERQSLEAHRRHERTMLRRLVDLVDWILTQNSMVEIFWEWPSESLGWKEEAMTVLEKQIWKANKDWLVCRMDGCRYGLRDGDKGAFIKKRWMIRTTCPRFHSMFKTKVCVQDHAHVPAKVMDQKGRLDYPWRFVSSVAKAWTDHLFPLRHLAIPTQAYNYAADELDGENPEEDGVDLDRDDDPPDPDQDGPSEEEKANWERKLRRFHNAAGHPSNSQLARIVKEAGKPKWMIDAAQKLHCPHCASVCPGGISSKQVPPLSTRPLPQAWQQVVSDVGEWTSAAHKCKLKFIVFVDAATRLRVAEPLFRCAISEMKNETGLQVVEAFSKRWLSDKPKPEIFIPDNATSFKSRHFQDFCSSVNIWVAPPAEAEAWAHGVAEAVVQDLKEVMEKIQLHNAFLQPETCLALATGALNQTSFVKGFSSYQWAYGKQFTFTDEDEITMSQVKADAPFAEFSRLLSLRHDAEQRAKEVRAQRVLSKLKNTIRRQPLRTFQPTEMVKVWRRALPLELHRGRDGGSKKAGRHHWIGPGRVVLHETVPHQAEDDYLRHIVWVVIGGKLYRCSAHSVRPVTEQERAWHHLQTEEDASKWRSLQDIIPTKEYTDLSNQEPPGDVAGDFDPDLPQAPDYETWMPSKRLRYKQMPPLRTAPPPVLQPVPEPVNDYDEYSPSLPPSEAPPPNETRMEDDEEFDRMLREGGDTGGEKRATSSTATPSPESKRARVDVDEFEEELTLHTALQESECAYIMEFDMNLMSQRQMKKFLRSPSAYLVGKMRDCEVRWDRLTPQQKELFTRAKTKEVSSFIKQEAVRMCHNYEEEQEVTGMRKAKARIVLLGYQHPDLLREGFSSSAPVQSVLTRNLAYQMAVHNGWAVEGLDLSTAFLQTAPKEEMRIWTEGVAELRQALGLRDDQLLRVLKDFYGSATAPRGLWKDLHGTFTKLGAVKIMSDPCMWIWSEKVEKPRNEWDQWRTIGMMGGHVDDFNRAGDRQNPRWCAIREQIDKAYQWGTIKHGSYRHAGTDIITRHTHDDGMFIEVNQDQYIEAIADFDLASQSNRVLDSPLTEKEVSSCRAALGALQWVAVQTQPLICARCNLIMSDLSNGPKFALAKEIQQLITEVKSDPQRLTFKRLPEVRHWQDMHVVTLGDQAHNNRPRGGSTGGLQERPVDIIKRSLRQTTV